MTSGINTRLPGSKKADGDRPKRRSAGSVFFRLIRLGLIVYLLLLLVLMIFEELLIFRPIAYPRGDWQPPGLNFEDAEFEAADGPFELPNHTPLRLQLPGTEPPKFVDGAPPHRPARCCRARAPPA